MNQCFTARYRLFIILRATFISIVFNNVISFSILVSGSNLASHMVGSLKKGSKPSSSISLPSSAYNTLPSQHHLRTSTSSPRFIGNTPPTTATPTAAIATKPLHKRSPSSDSGTGSNTPVSSYHSNSGAKTPVHHTVYLHGNYLLAIFKLFCFVVRDTGNKISKASFSLELFSLYLILDNLK